MKLHNTLAAALTLLSLTLIAQENNTANGNLKLDFWLAVSQNNVANNSASGFGLEKQIKGPFSIKSDFQYSIRGYGMAYKLASDNEVTGVRLHYVDVVPQLVYRANTLLSLSAGPYFGARCLEQTRTGGAGDWKRFKSDLHSFTSDVDMGAMIGMTFHVKRFHAFARYQLGLYPISRFEYTGENGENIGEGRLMNRSLLIGLGYDLFSSTKK
jgi:Outer membrane protein beta-barrel domain